MIKFIAIVVVVVVAALLILAATRPDTFRVQRTARIKALPEKVFAFINDFHRWDLWSPWEKMDPAMKRTYSGAENGRGAVYAWEGNKKVGNGRKQITQSSSPTAIAIKLDLFKPFEAHNIAEFTLEANGDFTDVTWAMQGSNPYIAKVMGLFFNMDRMVGKDFETGLANLKTRAEK